MTDGARRQTAQSRQRLLFLRALARSGSMTTAKTSAALLATLSSAGLIAEKDGAFVVTAAGYAWLRRQLASQDPFLEQHRETRRRPLAGARASASLVQVNDAESPLAWLRRRKDREGLPMLDDKQFDAGERLRRDYTFAAMCPRVTADWSGTPSASGQHQGGSSASAMRDDVVAAKQRVHRAITAVGPELGRILIDVCCLLKGIETAESEQGLPQRSGKVVLQLALTSLARHYGLLTESPRELAGGRFLHWGLPGFRPVI